MYIESLTKGNNTIKFTNINDSKILGCSLNSENNYTVWYMTLNLFEYIIYNNTYGFNFELGTADAEDWTMHLYG